MRRLLSGLAVLLFAATSHAADRRLFDRNWRFHLGDIPGAEAPAFPDRDWRQLDLPHDWSIEGPYSTKNASGTGYLPGGVGWYRTRFNLTPGMRGRKISIRFDGVYRDSSVWINGVLLGTRPYGYSSFEYDLTPHLRPSGTNVIAVRVDHSVVADSRWYTGSGIYRHVWLNVSDAVHIEPWGVSVTTPIVSEDEARVFVETRVVNATAAEQRITVTTTVLDGRGEPVGSATATAPATAAGGRSFGQQVAVTRPALWSPDQPNLYTAISRIYLGGKLVDEERTRFGMRTLRFTPDKGLILNGRPIKMKGVCIHHDLGALGAAFFEEALERRLRSFKEIGVNAIRGSHNPMAPEFYDLCDRLGFLVQDEAFDEWIGGKRKWAEGRNNGPVARRGYNEAFEAWSDNDTFDMVLRDRNHPSIVMWSIGNEIDYPDDPFSEKKGLSPSLMGPIARRLIAAVKKLDTTRPVTMALADINTSNATGVANLLDIVGYNYLEQFYERDHKAYPNRVIYGSENSRSLEAWRAAAVNDYVGGQFLWTGMNFLGEAGRYPVHGSNSGLLDLQGFWKRDAYLRQALWSEKPMVYAARSGDNLEIYSNCDSVEALQNGRSLGEKPIADRLKPTLTWAIPNDPGTIELVGKKAGAAAARFQLKPVGAPASIELLPDRKTLLPEGRQVATVEVALLDREGNRILDSTATVTFAVSGPGRLIAVGNADLRDETPVTGAEVKLYQGRAVAIVRSGGASGKITLRATAPGLPAAEVAITVAATSSPAR